MASPLNRNHLVPEHDRRILERSRYVVRSSHELLASTASMVAGHRHLGLAPVPSADGLDRHGVWASLPSLEAPAQPPQAERIERPDVELAHDG